MNLQYGGHATDKCMLSAFSSCFDHVAGVPDVALGNRQTC